MKPKRYRRRHLRRKRTPEQRRGASDKLPVHVTFLLLLAVGLGMLLPFQKMSSGVKDGAAAVTAVSEAEEGGYVTLEWVQTPEPVRIPEPSAEPSSAQADAEGTKILIYHTHATEAYRMTADDPYRESDEWRTEDKKHSVIAAGEVLSGELQKLGFTVFHDTTNYEPPKLSTAYSRSVIGMENWKAKHPDLRYYIDLHRDAYGSGTGGEEDYVLIEGKPCARMMFVVGTGEGAMGGGFGKMPDFAENLDFARRITEALREIDPLFMRDVRVKTGRYNQHVSNRCLLVEAGHNRNTLEQAKNSMPYLARAIAAAIKQDAA